MKRRIRLGLVEVPGTPGFDDPLMLDENLIDATNHVAQEADGFWTYFDFDLDGTTSAPVSSICKPRGDSGELYKNKSARVTTPSGKISLAEGRNIVTAAWMDKNVPEWRDTPATGNTPDYLVIAGPDYILYPLPTFTQAAGLRVYGFGTPGRLWDAEATTISDDDVFPLPNYAAPAVETYAKYLRCIQFPSKENMMRMQVFKDLFDNDLLPSVQALAANEYGRASL
jgi:hypothetical protein